MQIEFTRKLDNPDEYFVANDNKILFHASYDKNYETKYLYNEQRVKLGRIFPFYTRKLQFSPPHMIQLFENNNEEILIKTKSFWKQTFHFSYKGNYYELMKHFGVKNSVYKNQNQIAAYFPRTSSNMLLICNSDSDIQLICLISLFLFSSFGGEGDPASFNIIPFGKKFNSKWLPVR